MNAVKKYCAQLYAVHMFIVSVGCSENMPEITGPILRNGNVQKHRLESIFRLHATQPNVYGVLQ